MRSEINDDAHVMVKNMNSIIGAEECAAFGASIWWRDIRVITFQDDYWRVNPWMVSECGFDGSPCYSEFSHPRASAELGAFLRDRLVFSLRDSEALMVVDALEWASTHASTQVGVDREYLSSRIVYDHQSKEPILEIENMYAPTKTVVRASAALLNDQPLYKTVESMIKLVSCSDPVYAAQSSWNSLEEASSVGRTFRGYFYRNVPWPTVEVGGNTYVWRPKGIS